jgi:hypothetical protein
VQGGVELLKRNRNVLDGFKPPAGVTFVLLPVRSAGSVSAIFYVDGGREGELLPLDALRILAEFAGAQLDRLMALSGGFPLEVESVKAAEEEVASPEPVESTEVVGAEPVLSAPAAEIRESEPESPAVAPEIEVPSPAPEGEVVPAAEPVAPPAEDPAAPVAAPDSAKPDAAQLSEADQKIHRDARRFARLLVSEIELYSKTKVADGRKNKDIYRRLKSDIDRSRHTYEKRFSKTLSKHFDFFHEELVRSLASNDPSLLGTDYPGPAA